MRLGERITSREVAKVDRRLHSIYSIAKKELEETLADFNRKYAIKDKQKKALVASGKLSMQDYKDWQAGQVFIRKQWQDKLDSVCKIIHTHTQRAAEIVRKGQFEVFAENYNITAMDAERKTGISFNIYNTDAVSELIAEDPQTLPEWKIDEEKDYIWNKRKANNAVIQGIIQGDSIEDITKRLCNKLCTQNENRMRLFARTAMTEAQNSGRQQHMNEAAQKGIKQNKRWLATLDSRTRDVHRHLDGKEVAYNEPFKSDLGEIRYPGDPMANPANVYNCRCSIVTIYPEYEDYSKRDWREDEIIDGQTYEEWKKGKQNEIEESQSVVRKCFASELDVPLYPHSMDYSETEWDRYVDDVNRFEGERTEYIGDVRPNSRLAFSNGKYLYNGEPYCNIARIDNAISRLQEKYPTVENDSLILCDYANAWQYLKKGKDDKRWHEDTPIGQVFLDDKQIVIAFDRSYMLGTVSQSLAERERMLKNGLDLPNVFPIESPETVAIHEWGHVMYEHYTHALCYDDEDAKGLFSWYNTLTKDDIKTGLSEYGSEKFGEFCAECFAEMQTPDPRPIAKKYWQYMSRIIEKGYSHERK